MPQPISRKHLLAVAAAATLALTGVARADTIDFVAQGWDFPGTWIRADDPDDKAADHILFAGGLGEGSALRSVLSFDLSSLPDGAVIDGVQLKLTIDKNDDNSSNAGDTTIQLQELLVTPTHNATWNTYDGTTSWTTPGGDFDSTVLSSTTGDPTTTTSNQLFTFGSTSDFITAAQAAADADGTLDLIVRAPNLEASTDDRGLFRFIGPEGPQASGHPTLSLNYVPEPATAGLMALGGLMMLRRRAERRI